MTAISFKLPYQEALELRKQARDAQMTVSAFLRKLLNQAKKKQKPRVTIKYSKLTGAPAFHMTGDFPPLTVERVKELLVDFP